MKVLMFGWEFPPHISGGLGTACYGITKGLLQNEVEVIFVMPKSFGDEDTNKFRIINASDISIPHRSVYYSKLVNKLTYFGINSLIVPYLNTEEFQRYSEEKQIEKTETKDSFFTNRFEFTGRYGKDLMKEVWQYAFVASEIARTNSFDIIHAHDWLSFPAGIIAKEVSGKPLVVHVHATEFDRSGENINQLVYDVERQGMHAADKIIAVSELTRQIIINRYNISPEKVVVIHNAVEPTEKKTSPPVKRFKEKIVSYLGRVTFQKGPEYFIEAAQKVLQRDKNVRFIMAGNGDMLNRMIKRVAELRMSSNFHFTGFLKGNEVDEMFAMSSVYVMPSVSEPFGISPLEAIQSGVPVIISKQSGVNEVLNNAIKIDFWDTDAMANAIYSLTHFNGLSKMFVKKGKQEIENLKWEEQTKKMKELYQSILNTNQ